MYVCTSNTLSQKLFMRFTADQDGKNRSDQVHILHTSKNQISLILKELPSNECVYTYNTVYNSNWNQMSIYIFT